MWSKLTKWFGWGKLTRESGATEILQRNSKKSEDVLNSISDLIKGSATGDVADQFVRDVQAIQSASSNTLKSDQGVPLIENATDFDAEETLRPQFQVAPNATSASGSSAKSRNLSQTRRAKRESRPELTTTTLSIGDVDMEHIKNELEKIVAKERDHRSGNNTNTLILGDLDIDSIENEHPAR
jgi:hypothetical protein